VPAVRRPFDTLSMAQGTRNPRGHAMHVISVQILMLKTLPLQAQRLAACSSRTSLRIGRCSRRNAEKSLRMRESLAHTILVLQA